MTAHFNAGTYHNNFVNMEESLSAKKAYYKFRDLSDALCEKERLTKIKNPNGKTQRSMYFAAKRGEPTKYNLMRFAVDYAVSFSFDKAQFINVMKKTRLSC